MNPKEPKTCLKFIIYKIFNIVNFYTRTLIPYLFNVSRKKSRKCKFFLYSLMRNVSLFFYAWKSAGVSGKNQRLKISKILQSHVLLPPFYLITYKLFPFALSGSSTSDAGHYVNRSGVKRRTEIHENCWKNMRFLLSDSGAS